MSQLNRPRPTAHTHEGARAYTVSALTSLRRSVLAHFLWESEFYESGTAIAERITALAAQVKPADLAAIAIEAREQMKLRHVPLLLACELAKHPSSRHLLTNTVARIIQRPDELTELLAVYSRNRSGPKKLNKLSHGIRDGIALAFPKFDAYQLAKYDRPGAIKLRDALFLSHPKPRDEAQAATWKQLASGTLPAPDTWEVALSAGADKRETWIRLLSEQKLGALALLRNLRNMLQAQVLPELITSALANTRVDRILPFRFIAAAQHAPQLEPELETAMFRAVSTLPKLPGTTALLIDHSGSMRGMPIARRSDLDRFDAACALAILARELCENVRIFAFSDWFAEVPPRRGFALRDALISAGTFYGTCLGAAVREINTNVPYDRLIVITDEQSHDPVPNPANRGYMLNVASYRNGIGYGPWTHIDGWSESVLRYVQATQETPTHAQ